MHIDHAHHFCEPESSEDCLCASSQTERSAGVERGAGRRRWRAGVGRDALSTLSPSLPRRSNSRLLHLARALRIVSLPTKSPALLHAGLALRSFAPPPARGELALSLSLDPCSPLQTPSLPRPLLRRALPSGPRCAGTASSACPLSCRAPRSRGARAPRSPRRARDEERALRTIVPPHCLSYPLPPLPAITNDQPTLPTPSLMDAL